MMRPGHFPRLLLRPVATGAFALALAAIPALTACRRAPPKRAAAPPPPEKIVIDYRFGWYHTAGGSQSLAQIADEYQRDVGLVARLNQMPPDARPAAGRMIYIPPNNDPQYVREALVRINAHPEIVPTEPWHPPLVKHPVADLKQVIPTKSADAALKTVIGARPAPVVGDPSAAPAGGKESRPILPGDGRTLARSDPPSVPAGRPRTRDDAGFDWPVQGRVVTPFNEGWLKACHGIEVAAQAGSPVLAARTGKVLLAQEFPGYGRLILIDHGDGLASVYAYLDALLAREGERVERGRKIATVGRKGSTPLFFFQIRKQGRKVDPMDYLK